MESLTISGDTPPHQLSGSLGNPKTSPSTVKGTSLQLQVAEVLALTADRLKKEVVHLIKT